MIRIRRSLVKYNAISSERATSKHNCSKEVWDFINDKQLTYCPEEIILPSECINRLILDKGQKLKRDSKLQN